MDKINCNLCKADDCLFLFRRNKFNPPLEIVKCKQCGLIYQNPRPDEDGIKSLYSEGYYTGSSQAVYVKDLYKERIIANERLKILEKMKSPGRSLDIGCCFGAFLDVAQSRGWDSYGVDIAPFAVEKTRNKGLKISLGEVSSVHFDNKFFDLVTMTETIEHLRDPLETLIETRRILKDNGILYIQTTNMDSLRARLLSPKVYYYLPTHLYYFTKKTITEMLKKSGFKIFNSINGSEFDILTEFKLFKGEVSFGAIFVRKLLNKIEFRGFTLNSNMVIYAKKSN